MLTVFPAYHIPAEIRKTYLIDLLQNKSHYSIERIIAIASLELALYWCNNNIAKALSEEVQYNARQVIELWLEGLGYTKISL